MNVVILNDFGFVSGGAASVAISSAKGLAARGHRVIFFTAVGPIDPRLVGSGIEVIDTGQANIRADTSRLTSQLLMTWNPLSARLLDRTLSELDPKDTILHLHNWTKALSASVARVGISRRFKLVCTLHDYAVACPRGSFFDRSTMEHCHLKPLSWNCISRDCGGQSVTLRSMRTLRQATQQRFGSIPAGVDAFVLVTHFSRALLEPNLPKSSAIWEIPSPIEIERTEPVDVANNKALLMLGRLTIEKGALLLARAARQCGLPLIFAGDGPCRSEIATEYPEATITGWLPRHEIDTYVRKARALVFPSLMYETQGLVVPEAAALGVPAVISDTSAAVEGIVDGINGLFFKNGDLIALKASLGLLSDDAFVRRLGIACHEAYWKMPPTVERHVELLEELYHSVLHRSAAEVQLDSSRLF